MNNLRTSGFRFMKCVNVFNYRILAIKKNSERAQHYILYLYKCLGEVDKNSRLLYVNFRRLK